MKKYEVILDWVPNKSDFDDDEKEPQTKSEYFEIEADSEEEALSNAKSQFTQSVWSSSVSEV